MLDDDEVEPPVPPGLGQLSASLSALAEFLRIDEHLVAVAAARSAAVEEAAPSSSDLERWIRHLPDAEKNDLLLRLAAGETHLSTELLRRFRQATAPAGSPQPQTPDGGRTVAELVAAAEARAEAQRRAEAEHRAREHARQEQERAAARAKHLDGLVGREEELWRQAEPLIETKRPKEYDEAVRLLVDLRDLAARDQTTRAFQARLNELRARHARKPSFLERPDRAGLSGG